MALPAEILERMTGSVRRFKVTLGFVAACTVFFTYLVIIEDFDDVYFYALTGLFIAGAVSLLRALIMILSGSFGGVCGVGGKRRRRKRRK